MALVNQHDKIYRSLIIRRLHFRIMKDKKQDAISLTVIVSNYSKISQVEGVEGISIYTYSHIKPFHMLQ